MSYGNDDKVMVMTCFTLITHNTKCMAFSNLPKKLMHLTQTRMHFSKH